MTPEFFAALMFFAALIGGFLGAFIACVILLLPIVRMMK